MSLPAAPRLELGEVTETSISVRFQPPSDGGLTGASYVLQWKEYPAGWDAASSAKANVGSGGSAITAEAAPLQPGSTYCVRLVAVGPDGQEGPPGPELVADTEAVGCTPSQKSSCCTVL